MPQCALEMSLEEQRAPLCLSLCPHRNTCTCSKKEGQLCMGLATHVCPPPKPWWKAICRIIEQEHEKNGDVVQVLKLEQVQKMKHFSIGVLVDGNVILLSRHLWPKDEDQ